MKSGFALFLAIVFISCSPKDNSETPVVGKDSLKTDSGILTGSFTNNTPNGITELRDNDGKLLQRGRFEQGQPVGAWVQYDASGKVIDAKHVFGNKVLTELDPTDFQFKTWHNDAMGLSLNIPNTWKELPTPNDNLVASFEKQIVDTALRIKPSVNVAVAQLEADQTLEKLAATQLEMLHQQSGRVELVNESAITIDSCSAFRRYGMFYNDNSKVGFLMTIVVKGNRAWFFSCNAQNMTNGEFLRYQGVFEEIVETAQFD
jgi:hypothetical protein